METKSSILWAAQKFSVDVKTADMIKTGVYRLVTKAGKQYCLKRMTYSPQQLNWIDAALRTLRSAGFKNIAWRNPSAAHGKILYARKSEKASPYILTPWISGREPDAASIEDMSACAKALAVFHKAGREVSPAAAGEQNFLKRWPRILRGYESVLRRALLEARDRKKKTAFDMMLLSNGKELMTRAHDAMQALEESDYLDICQQAAKQGTLCHGDCGPKNFVLTDKGPWLIDFETLRLDLRAYDLFRLIRLASKKNGWDFSVTEAILDSYQSVSELQLNEFPLIKVWLQFPYKICKILAQYEQVPIEKKYRLYEKVEEALENEKNISPFLQELDEYAIVR